MIYPWQYEVRRAGPEDAAALFVIHAAITAADANDMLAWTQELEDRLETGSHAWVIAKGRRLMGYAAADPVPGLPGVYDLLGGIVPTRRGRGLGTRLLRDTQAAAFAAGIRRLSCRVQRLEDETAAFLLRRGFDVEHEECLLELPAAAELPTIPEEPRGEFLTLPRERAIAAFLRVYDESFAGLPWSQPYTAAEVAAMLARPADLLYLAVDERIIGVVWHELLPGGRGRVEPIGIAAGHWGQGHGRRLLLAALRDLRGRGAAVIEIGLWRENAAAMNLYISLGFREVANWYYLSCDVEGLKAE